jgi:hypothetical protein
MGIKDRQLCDGFSRVQFRRQNERGHQTTAERDTDKDEEIRKDDEQPGQGEFFELLATHMRGRLWLKSRLELSPTKK